MQSGLAIFLSNIFICCLDCDFVTTLNNLGKAILVIVFTTTELPKD